ncbi:hypothetical protein I302_100596 [Kwoniella bestiolae CBS 10118]|uniref:Uncharacterized protein n=1 Tax=Kwoniella bestiolae CBS 10118 TaxID=1296100 RepID=A0AAJ8K092_9TREE
MMIHRLTRSANERLREMYKADEHDLHTHRLNILNPSKATTDDTLLDSLYSTVLPRKNLAIRPHQSQQELEKRAEKRRMKEESRIAKQSTRTQPLNGSSTKTKRKKKQKQK